MNNEPQSKPRPKVRISWQSPSIWLVKWAGGLVCKLERTKTGLVRVRSIYFCGKQSSMAQTLDRLHDAGFAFSAQRRDARYCKGKQEYRLTATVAILEKMEQFIVGSFLAKLQPAAPIAA